MQKTAIEQAAKSLDLALEILQVRSVADFDQAFATAAGQRAGALLMLSSPLFGSSTRTVAELALRRFRRVSEVLGWIFVLSLFRAKDHDPVLAGGRHRLSLFSLSRSNRRCLSNVRRLACKASSVASATSVERPC
jgi:hypothetical protein